MEGGGGEGGQRLELMDVLLGETAALKALLPVVMVSWRSVCVTVIADLLSCALRGINATAQFVPLHLLNQPRDPRPRPALPCPVHLNTS